MTPISSKPGFGMDLKLLHFMNILLSQCLHDLEKIRALSSPRLGKDPNLPIHGPRWPLYGPIYLTFNGHDH